jgi:hypothetical protein
MEAYGRKRQHPGNLPDNHPSKGFVNWWEVEYEKVKSKKTARQSAKTEIQKEDVCQK